MFLESSRETTASRLVVGALVALFAATPVSITQDANSILQFALTTASAKDGGRDASGSGSGSGSGGDDSSDTSDHSGRGGGDDGGRGDGGWHDTNSRGRGGGGDDIKVIYGDGFQEEIRKGTLTLKDPQGRSVVTRRATKADITRLRNR